MAIRRQQSNGAGERAADQGLPACLRPLFWQYHFRDISWEKDRDLIIARVLSAGDWEAVRWLRSRIEDSELRAWIERRHGRGLDARRLRFWELILGIPRRRVNTWLRQPGRQVWEGRLRR